MTSAVGATRVVIGEVDEKEVCDFVRNNRHVFDLITKYTDQLITKEHIREEIRVATAVLVALTRCNIPRRASEIKVSKKVFGFVNKCFAEVSLYPDVEGSLSNIETPELKSITYDLATLFVIVGRDRNWIEYTDRDIETIRPVIEIGRMACIDAGLAEPDTEELVNKLARSLNTLANIGMDVDNALGTEQTQKSVHTQDAAQADRNSGKTGDRRKRSLLARLFRL